MTSIRSRYFFPPRPWRRMPLRCHCADGRFSPRDAAFVVGSTFPEHAELRLSLEQACGDVVADPRSNPQGIQKC